MSNKNIAQYHRDLDQGQIDDIDLVSDAVEALLEVIASISGDGRCLALARTNAEQALMWAEKGVAG